MYEFLFLIALAIIGWMAFPLGATPITRTDLTNTLKINYASDKMYQVFNRNHVGLAKVDRNPQDVDEGLQFKYNVHTGGTSAGTHIAENGTLPGVQANTNDWLIFNMKTYTHRIMLSGQVMHTTKSKKAAMVKALTFQASNAVADSKLDFGFGLYVPAIGKMTMCQAVVSNSPTAIVRVESTRRLRKNMRIAVLDTSGLAATNGVADAQIYTINHRTRQVTLKQTDTASTAQTLGGTSWSAVDAYGNSNHAIYLYGAPTAAVRPWGLEDLINDSDPDGSGVVGDFGGVSRDSDANDWARGRAKDAAGNPITNALADEVCTMVETEGNGKIGFWLTTYEIYRDICRFPEGDKRAGMKEKVGNTWFSRGFLADLPVYPCKMCTPRTIYGIDPDGVWYAENKPLDWEAEDGAMMARVADKWAYEALLTRMYQLIGIPNSHAVIRNVASTSPVQ